MQNVFQIARNKNKFGNIVMIKLESFELEKMLNVTKAAGNKIIHSDNLISFFDETVAEVGA